MKMIDHCEVCGAKDLTPVLSLGKHPLCDDLLPIGSQEHCKTYPIEILYCKHCCTAHQKYQVDKETLFPAEYHYRSRFTKDVLDGMKDFVRSCKEKTGSLKGKTVVDVGCNDGSLLGYFREEGCATIGIEPTNACEYAGQSGHKVYQEYFTEELANRICAEFPKVDFIVFTNVFAHIDNLPALLRAIQVISNEDTMLVIENHYLGEILEKNQFDTFYHEHPRTYSLTSFSVIAQAMGRQLLDVQFPKRYGGNIRVFIGKSGIQPNQSAINAVLEREKLYPEKFEDMKHFIGTWKECKRKEIEELYQKYGKLRAKAFPGRAAILVKLLELDQDRIQAVYEKPGSMKIGNYLPGTRIEIHSDEELFSLKNQNLPILNFAWHIPREIREYLKAHGYTGEVIDIV